MNKRTLELSTPSVTCARGPVLCMANPSSGGGQLSAKGHRGFGRGYRWPFRCCKVSRGFAYAFHNLPASQYVESVGCYTHNSTPICSYSPTDMPDLQVKEGDLIHCSAELHTVQYMSGIFAHRVHSFSSFDRGLFLIEFLGVFSPRSHYSSYCHEKLVVLDVQLYLMYMLRGADKDKLTSYTA
jgi:hypothetical protein